MDFMIDVIPAVEDKAPVSESPADFYYTGERTPAFNETSTPATTSVVSEPSLKPTHNEAASREKTNLAPFEEENIPVFLREALTVFNDEFPVLCTSHGLSPETGDSIRALFLSCLQKVASAWGLPDKDIEVKIEDDNTNDEEDLTQSLDGVLYDEVPDEETRRDPNWEVTEHETPSENDDDSDYEPKNKKRKRGRPRKTEEPSSENNSSATSRKSSKEKKQKKVPKRLCDHCGQKFRDGERLKVHLFRVHKEGVKLAEHTCGECGKVFPLKRLLKLHLATTHQGPRLVCEQCGRQYKSKSALDNHVEAHKNVKHPCEICGKNFRSNGHLRAHLTWHKMKSERNVEFQCEDCGIVLSSGHALTNHTIRKHGTEDMKQFACNQCDRKFVSNWILRLHLIKHAGERKFPCDECGLAFFEQSALTQHKNKHTNHKAYACKVCGETFLYSGSRHNHMKIKHPEILKPKT